MAEYIIQDTTLTGIADAIRSKTGGSDPIATSAFAETIAAIEVGGGSETRVLYGTVTPAEDISGQLPLFEVSEANFAGIPDALMLFYAPQESVIGTPVDGRLCADITIKYNQNRVYLMNYTRSSSKYYFPYVGNMGSSIVYSTAVKNNILHYPYSMSSSVFAAGERYYYVAVYSGKDMRP